MSGSISPARSVRMNVAPLFVAEHRRAGGDLERHTSRCPADARPQARHPGPNASGIFEYRRARDENARSPLNRKRGRLLVDAAVDLQIAGGSQAIEQHADAPDFRDGGGDEL